LDENASKVDRLQVLLAAAAAAEGPTFAEMLPLLQAAALKYDLDLTRRQYDGLRRTPGFAKLLPPHYRLQATINEAIPKPTVIPLDNGMSVAAVSLRDSILADFLVNPRLGQHTHHAMKIGGDASTDHKEKDELARSILLLTYAWNDITIGLGANSVRSHRIISAAWAKETFDSVQSMCALLDKELRLLRDNGLDVPQLDGTTVHHTFSFTLSGDLKWLHYVYGRAGPGSSYPCLYCWVKKGSMGNCFRTKSKNIGKSFNNRPYDVTLSEMTTIASMNKMAAKAAQERAKLEQEEKEKKESKDEKIEKDDKEEITKVKLMKDGKKIGVLVMNQEWAPSISIEPCDCPMERLHCLLRLTEIFERLVAADLVKTTTVPVVNPKTGKKRRPMTRARLDGRYQTTLKQLGVHRSITGLTGVECRRILDQPDVYLQDIAQHREYKNILLAMKGLAKLDRMMSNVESDEQALEYGKAAHAWARALTKWLPSARQNIYVHIMAVHSYRWRRIGDSSTYALEKTNAVMKAAKKRTRADRKVRVPRTTKSAAGQLSRMVAHVNTGNVLTFHSPVPPSTKRALTCRACGGDHYKSYSLCPVKIRRAPPSQQLPYNLQHALGKRHAREQERARSLSCKKRKNE
jgi:hypothetical protein